MHLIKSAVIAFSLYSRLPMPRLAWKDEDMRYVFCFFPLVGALVGVLFAAVFAGCSFFGLGGSLTGALLAALPLFVTGGIHMDGFLDTSDALACMGSREKKLSVLKDSHVGAFALIRGLVYMTLWAGGAGSIETTGQAVLMSVCFVVSRALSGLTFVNFPDARRDGLKAGFSRAAGKGAVNGTCICTLAACFAILAWRNLHTAAWLFVAALLLLLYYRHMGEKQFGGITGDLAGYYLQLQELAYLLVIVCTAV